MPTGEQIGRGIQRYAQQAAQLGLEQGRRAAATAARQLAGGQTAVPVPDPGEMPLPPRILGYPKDTVLAIPASGQRLYRLADDPLEVSAFHSRYSLNRRPYPGVSMIVYVGLSGWEELSQVLSRARRRPITVAEVTLAEGLGFHIAKTFGPGHYSFWGDADALFEQASVIHREI